MSDFTDVIVAFRECQKEIGEVKGQIAGLVTYERLAELMTADRDRRDTALKEQQEQNTEQLKALSVKVDQIDEKISCVVSRDEVKNLCIEIIAARDEEKRNSAKFYVYMTRGVLGVLSLVAGLGVFEFFRG